MGRAGQGLDLRVFLGMGWSIFDEGGGERRSGRSREDGGDVLWGGGMGRREAEGEAGGWKRGEDMMKWSEGSG